MQALFLALLECGGQLYQDLFLTLCNQNLRHEFCSEQAGAWKTIQNQETRMEKLLNLVLLATNLHGLQMPLQHFRKSRDKTPHPIVCIGVLLWFWQQKPNTTCVIGLCSPKTRLRAPIVSLYSVGFFMLELRICSGMQQVDLKKIYLPIDIRVPLL